MRLVFCLFYPTIHPTIIGEKKATEKTKNHILYSETYSLYNIWYLWLG